MEDNEEYFPRGGKKPVVKHFKQSNNFLGAPDQSEKKKKRGKKKSEGDDGYLSDEEARDLGQSYKNCAHGLGYKTTKPGLVLLGRVRQVQETKVNLMLPGRMMGTVMACHISEPYNKILEEYVSDKRESVKDLKDMFRPGQYVSVKVLEAEKNHLMLSMMPNHICEGKRQADLVKGSILQAAVSSVEDHGYIMDIGIAGVKAFLPKSNADPEVELDIGMLCWCCVKSCPPDGVVTLSSAVEALQGAVLRKQGALLPGAAVDFVVDKPLDNGIEGHVFQDTTAYIQRHHADSVKGKKPGLGQRIRARVLYTMPPRHTPYLTMKDIFSPPSLGEEQQYQEGDIIDDAQVLKISGRSVLLRLGAGAQGSLGARRVRVEEDLTDEQVVAKSYPIGSSHRVRVLCYNLCDYSYSVTDEAALLAERYFSLAQLRAGALVDGVVGAVGDHVTVRVGRLTGYVPHSHLTDAGVFVDPKRATTSKLPKKKFKEGQAVRARVLAVDVSKPSLLLTLKPSLLREDLELLQRYDQAQVGKGYTGVVKYIKNEYVLVSFFDHVVALVPRNYVTKDPADNVYDAFHVGQIVRCTILKVDAEAKKMTGSLTTEPFWPAKKREITQKRKQESADDIPKKKQKSDPDTEHKTKKDKQTDDPVTEKKKKKDKEKEADTETVKGKKNKDKTIDTDTTEDIKEKKSKKIKKAKEIEEKHSEESDAIETDIHEEEILTPEEQALTDLTDCVTVKDYKKRVVSILKNINNKNRRITRIDKKIEAIEERGLTPKTKRFHTAMHMEKLVIEERIKIIMEALQKAQEKLKEFNVEDKPKKKDKKKDKVAKDDNVLPDDEDEIEDNVKKVEKRKKTTVVSMEGLAPVLDVPSAKDFWSDEAPKTAAVEDSSSSEDEEAEQPKKKRKKLTIAEKQAKAREEEARLREAEARAAEAASRPRSSDQFERALLAQPDSSQLWIAYMAFHLQATELEKARAVARKALSTISFREEAERLNVWLALLNCEHRFGTKELQQKTLEEALQLNEPQQVHLQLLDILVDTGKHQELAALADLITKKYRREPKVYIACGAACCRLGLVEKARHIMQRGVAVLDKKEHVNLLVQFALLERAHGAAERAEALLEQVLAVYPARVDVAAVYVDMLLKSGQVDNVRQVLERMTSQKLPARKMKVLYKKWVEVEERLGEAARAQEVRQRALQYIDSAKF